MNKRKNRLTPFSGEYKMPVDQFCEKYNIDLKTIMRRMNVLYWEDFDALIVPTDLGDITPSQIRRTLVCLENGWKNTETAKRVNISTTMVRKISKLDSYRKNVFLDMDNYFYLNPANVDVSKIFRQKSKRKTAQTIPRKE